jgi:hypothetical protein
VRKRYRIPPYSISPPRSPPLPVHKGGKKKRKRKKLFSSISTNVCDVTHPCDTKINPTPPRSAVIHPAHLRIPLSHLLRRFSSNPPPECLKSTWNIRFFPVAGGLEFGFRPILTTKFSITVIAVIENLWSHGRGKVMSKRRSRFCVPNNPK